MLARILTVALSLAFVLSAGSCDRQGSGKVKIGFLVKQPEEVWFRLEWQFARQAAEKYGFDLVTLGTQDSEKLMAAIDNLAAQGAQGFVVCTPDVRLGPAIVAKARENNLKLMSVDDQFVGHDGKFMTDVPHVGISARNIGKLVGAELYKQMIQRKWDPAETAVCVVTFDELDTARERTDGAMEALIAAGFPKEKLYRTAQKTSDVNGAFDAANVLLTQHAEVKRWLICGMNDSAALGAVRAMEGRGFTPENSLAIGINGTDCIDELAKPKPTAFYASVLLTARRHGYETAELMYKWIKEGKEPPKATYTDGILITRENYVKVRAEQGITQ